MKRFISVIVGCALIVGLLSTCFVLPVAAKTNEYTIDEILLKTSKENSYDTFLSAIYESGNNSISCLAEEAVQNDGGLEWSVLSDRNASYLLKIKYKVLVDSAAEIEGRLLVNDKLQYNELDGFIFQKEYYSEGEVKCDIYGNDITPKQILSKEIIEGYIFDYAGVYSTPLSINLSAGETRIRLEYDNREIELISLELTPHMNDGYNYTEYSKEHADKAVYSKETFTLQGESAVLKSSSVLYPVSDRTSPKVVPSKVGKITLNTIGGNNWKVANTYIKWNVDVPQSGMYSISIKYKQNLNVGQRVYRSLYINGDLPFSEAASLCFEYSSKWQNITLSNKGQTYLFYLEKGKNEIKLQATLGNTDAAIRAGDNCVNELNRIYRKMLVVLGSEPDTSKDYKFEKNMPEVVESLSDMADMLDVVADKYESFNGSSTSATATIAALSRQLRKMNKDTYQIASEFSYFKTNIGSLGTYQASLKQQPLLIDYLALGGENPALDSAEAGFFGEFFFGFKEFLCSFAIDYKSIGSLSEKNAAADTITVWMTNGRDQSQVMRSLISEDFTPNSGYMVNLELVSAAALLPATVANIGPDVAIEVSSTSVIDYSMRNAAYNLREFEDFEKISECFVDAAFIPLEYMGGIYALPTGMDVDLLYYRKDILEDLGLEVPKTWNEVVAMSSVLSVNNMSFGLPSGNKSFLMMLRQNNLEIYNEDSTKCVLDSAKAIDVFRFYVNFYNNYSFPITYSLVNRFRTGEIPIAVAAADMYNNLEISAPEIKGLWDFTVLPGFADETGNINNSSLVGGTATMLLKNSDNPQIGWEFIKWWSSAEVQATYGREIESRLGSSGRYTSANRYALENSCWSKHELSVITEQLKSVSALEQVPGGYYLTRNLDNAFRNAVYYDKEPIDVMFDYVYKINNEIIAKRTELGLKNAE